MELETYPVLLFFFLRINDWFLSMFALENENWTESIHGNILLPELPQTTTVQFSLL